MISYDFTSSVFLAVWEKVVAAVKAYAGNLKADVERMVQKYKPRIIEQLKKFKKVVIDEGKQLLIDMLGDAIKIIIRGGLPYEVQENDFKSGMYYTWITVFQIYMVSSFQNTRKQ